MHKYNVEEYRRLNELSFRYLLSENEKNIITRIIHQVLNKYNSPTETIPFVKSQLVDLNNLYNTLDYFFKNQPGSYFIRTSNCSPKDAYYQLYSETPNIDEVEDMVITLEEIERDLEVLKVNNAEECLLVLCHSERIYQDMKYSYSTDNSIILMEWKDDIILDTETRCFVKNNKIIGFSQYYCDLENGYTSVFNQITVEKLAKLIINFLNIYISSDKYPYCDAVIDIALSKNIKVDANVSVDHIIFIEINPFNEDTDSCLYTWEHLFDIDENSIDFYPTFLYKKDGLVEKYHYLTSA